MPPAASGRARASSLWGGLGPSLYRSSDRLSTGGLRPEPRTGVTFRAWSATSPGGDRAPRGGVGPARRVPHRGRRQDGGPRPVRPARAGGVRRHPRPTSRPSAFAVEELGAVDSSMRSPCPAGVGLGIGPILALRDRRPARPVAPRPRRGPVAERVRPDGGRQDPTPAPVAHAVADGHDWVIDGSKEFITNSGTLPDERHHRGGADRRRHQHVPRPDRTPGLHHRACVPEDGLACVRHPPAYFDACRVPRDNLLGEPGPRLRSSSSQILDGGRAAIAALALGLAAPVPRRLCRVRDDRQTFGGPIARSRG